MNVVFVGATRGMGRALARQLAARGDRLFLLGRDVAELDATATDLAVRAGRELSQVVVGHARLDLAESSTLEPALAAAAAALGAVDAVVVTAGLFAPMATLDADLERAAAVLHVNFTATILLCEYARRLLLPRGGTLVVFGSVAGDRGRKPVAIYGATKAGLAHYLESIDHRFASQGLRVVVVKPGFVRTAMTAGLPEPPFAGEPDAVARRVVVAMDRATPVIYAPAIWRLVMWVIRSLPRWIMRKVGF